MSPIPVKLFLKSLKQIHPDIPLPHLQTVVLGRSSQTKVKDTKVSRKHLSFKANCFSRSVEVIQLGPNLSVVRGHSLKRDEAITIQPQDVVELVEGDHRYELVMEGAAKVVKVAREDRPNTHPGHWSMALLRSIKDESLKLAEDEQVVVIRDAYPKARSHYLVIAKDDIDSLKEVDRDHLELIQHMKAQGETWAAQHPHAEFRMGFHAVPSMARLHLHVVSQDFDSPCLKNLKHWNSFTSEFFIPVSRVVETLQKDGMIPRISGEEAKAILAQPLACHKCPYKPKHLPDLKKHVVAKHFPK